MSYCRWSSDNWKSDIYCYEADCFYIEIAARRRVGVEKLPPDPMIEMLMDADRDANTEVWKRKYREHRTALSDLPLEDITLPHAGECIECATAGECAEKLKELREIGYHVPQYAIDALEDEARDEEAA
jgi:hypothetical protein